MPFSDEKKHFIKILHKEKRYCSHKFIREFPNKNWSRRGLNHLIKKIDESDLTVRTASHDDSNGVADLVQSQDRPQTRCSVRQISRETGGLYSTTLICS